MKNLILFLFLITVTVAMAAPFKHMGNPLVIGSKGVPDSSALVEIKSTTQGLLPSRMTTAERDSIASPATGLQIYNTDDNYMQVYDGTSWISLGVAGGGFTSGSVLFAGPTGILAEDNTNLFWDDTNNTLRIGSGTADTSSIFDVFSTTKGTRPCPSMTEAQRNAITTPANGLCVFNTDTSKLNIYNSSIPAWESAGGGVDKWVTSYTYKVDDVIWEPLSDRIYRCTTGHTSGVFSTDIANWAELSGPPSMDEITFPVAFDINSPTHMGNLKTMWDHMFSSGVTDGCAITDNLDGTISIASGSAILRSSNDDHGSLYRVNVNAQGPISLTDQATNYISLDWNAGSPQFIASTSEASFDCLDTCLAFVVARDGTSLNIIDAREQNIDSNTKSRRLFLHFSRFIHKEGGSAIAEVGTRNVSVTAGSFYFMMNEQAHPAWDTSVTDTFKYWYKDGTGWTGSATATQIDNTQYNIVGTGLTALGTNKYKVEWVYIVHDSPSTLHVVYSPAEYNNAAEAEAATAPIDLPVFISGTGSLIGRFIMQEGTASAITVESAFTNDFSATTATTHNNLAGLQGGTVDEYYHFQATPYSFLSAQDQSVYTTSSPTFSDLTLTNDLIFSSAGGSIQSNTVDGSDTFDFTVTAGGAGDVSRGSVLRYAGNESTFTGDLLIALGDNAAAEFQVAYGAGVTIGGLMDSNGKWTLGTTAGTQTHIINGSLSSTVDLNATGKITTGNLQLQTNTISSTDVNGNILITPNGAGEAVLSSPLQSAHETTPASPASGSVKEYVKSDGKKYLLDSDGREEFFERGLNKNYKQFNRVANAANAASVAVDFTTGSNATFDGGGTITASEPSIETGALDSTDTKFYQYNMGAVNDYWYFTVPTDQATTIGYRFRYSYDGADNDIELEIKCATSGTILTANDPVFIKASGLTSFPSSVYVPSGCGSLKFGFSVAVANAGKTFKFNRVALTDNPSVYKNLIKTASVSGAGNGGTAITSGVTNIDFTEVSDTHGAWNGTQYTIQNNTSIVYIKASSFFTTSTNDSLQLYKNGTSYKRIGHNLTGLNHQGNYVSDLGEFSAGDILSLRMSTTGGTLSNNSVLHYININEQWESEHVITPARVAHEEYRIDGHAGYGSTNNKIPYFTGANERVNTISKLGTVANSAVDGWSFTALKKVKVTMSYMKQHAAAGTESVGISLNSTELTTSLETITASDRVALSGNFTATTNLPNAVFTGYLEIGDVLRPHTSGAAPQTAALSILTITVEDVEATLLAAIPVQKTAYLKDVKASGTAGGASSAGINTRVLNTVSGDSEILSLSSNQFTLSPGIYEIEASAPAHQSSGAQLLIYNTTDTSYDLVGENFYSASSVNTQINPTLSGKLVVTASKTYELRQWIGAAKTTDGLGVALSSTYGEVYAQIKITKIKDL